MDRRKPYRLLILLGLLCCPPALRAGEPAPAPAAGPADAGKKPALTKNEIAVWSLFSVTGAALISGGVFGLAALEEQDRYDKNPASVYENRRDERMIASAVSFGVAGAAAIATIALFAIDRKHRPGKPEPGGQPGASVSFDPGGALRVAF